MKFAALLLALVVTWARADVSPRGFPPDPCRSRDEGAACKTEIDSPGKCAWLTHQERDRLDLRTRTRCLKLRESERCLTCVSEAYQGGAAPRKSAEESKAPVTPNRP